MIVSVDFAHTNGRRDQPFLGTANSKCRAASDADAFGHLWLIPAIARFSWIIRPDIC
jgi:hypothetical protein